jgi:hypothetical protein
MAAMATRRAAALKATPSRQPRLLDGQRLGSTRSTNSALCLRVFTDELTDSAVAGCPMLVHCSSRLGPGRVQQTICLGVRLVLGVRLQLDFGYLHRLLPDRRLALREPLDGILLRRLSNALDVDLDAPMGTTHSPTSLLPRGRRFHHQPKPGDSHIAQLLPLGEFGSPILATNRMRSSGETSLRTGERACNCVA